MLSIKSNLNVSIQSNSYEKLEQEGKFTEILKITRTKQDVEDKYYEIYALNKVGKFAESLELCEKHRSTEIVKVKS